MHEEINVSIVCPNSLVKEGLRRILSEDTFSVRHSLGNAASLLNDESEGAFLDDGELVLFESSGPDIDQDIRALHEKHPNCKLVLLADSFDFDGMIDAFRAGADGYIIKDIECQSLIESLKLIALGEKVLPSQLVKHLPLRSAMENGSLADQSELLDSLSDRELETLRCLIMGYPNKVIAYRLDISEATVKVHVKAILRKLGVQNRTQAAIWAVNNGLDANAACATLAAKSPNDNAEEGDIEAISAGA
ncbi:LuxR C-terminal-related transcriptional regulator [Erythrobacter sp. GH1-10]|uniref:LuxR C-terminal-related transcriptional regulator n=1 Tax=Erythrobacter sp. GH1-10 TaxID=3349334 RepID=UPI0038781F1F